MQPATAEEVLPSYAVGGGSIDLDLSKLTNGIVITEANAGLGTVSVIVPQTADVELTCSSSLGSVECLGQEQNGTDTLVHTMDYGTDGPGGVKITLDARANSGTVLVRRG
jgi:predicted membrane protein